MQTRTKRTVGALVAVVLVLAVIAALAREDIAEPAIGRESQEQLTREVAISQPQAEAAALKAVPGTVKKTALEHEEGRVVYEVEIQPLVGGNDINVIVDAVTGEVFNVDED